MKHFVHFSYPDVVACIDFTPRYGESSPGDDGMIPAHHVDVYNVTFLQAAYSESALLLPAATILSIAEEITKISEGRYPITQEEYDNE